MKKFFRVYYYISYRLKRSTLQAVFNSNNERLVLTETVCRGIKEVDKG